MIEVRDVSKCFEDIQAVDHVSINIKEDSVFGLIGTNGAGKSTILRMISGVIRPDGGEILIDGIPVFDHAEAKERLFFIADEPYFFANSTPEDMGRYFRVCADNRDLNYDKYFADGQIYENEGDAYTSHNTRRLDLNETAQKLLTADFVKEQLEKGGNQ